MRYLGGKARTARRIVNAMLADAGDVKDSTFIEPFLGGGSIMAEVAKRHAFKYQIAADALDLTTEYWDAIKSGWRPPAHVSREEYLAAKRSRGAELPAPLRAHYAFSCSFGGKFWGGYAADETRPNCGPAHYAGHAGRKDAQLRDIIQHVRFLTQDYRDTARLAASGDVLYCDPPYSGTTAYSATPGFSHDEFWSAMQESASAGVLVYVSEYEVPQRVPHSVIFSRQVQLAVSRSSDRTVVDKLFRIHTD